MLKILMEKEEDDDAVQPCTAHLAEDVSTKHSEKKIKQVSVSSKSPLRLYNSFVRNKKQK
jgi:hypothetical protein